MQILSSAVYRHSSPTKKPLLRMLWWDRVAPFGKPVVPEVYWMLIASSAESSIASSAVRSAFLPVSRRACHSGVPSSTTCSRSAQRGRTSVIIAA